MLTQFHHPELFIKSEVLQNWPEARGWTSSAEPCYFNTGNIILEPSWFNTKPCYFNTGNIILEPSWFNTKPGYLNTGNIILESS